MTSEMRHVAEDRCEAVMEFRKVHQAYENLIADPERSLLLNTCDMEESLYFLLAAGTGKGQLLPSGGPRLRLDDPEAANACFTSCSSELPMSACLRPAARMQHPAPAKKFQP